MPRKSKNAKHHSRKRKPMKRNVNIEVNRQKASVHNPIVPKYQTHLEASFLGNFPIASLTSQYFDLPIGNMSFPYNGGGIGTAFPGTFIGPTAITALNPIGYTLLTNLYSSCLSMGVKHEIIISPTLTTDAMQIVVVPLSATNMATWPTDFQSALAMPYSKSKTCIAFQNKENMISISVKPWVLLGLTKKQYYDEQQNFPVVAAAPNESVGVVRVFYQTFDVGVTAGITTVQVKSTFNVEFYNPDQNLLDT